MKTISFINLKGGVGKTISAINFAYLLAEAHNKRVLLIDNDKQGNTTRFFDRYDFDQPSAADILMLELLNAGEAVQKTQYSNLDLLPANMNLAAANMEIYRDTQREQLSRLRNALAPLQGEYDYCVIDNAPDVNMGIWNALVASDEYIIPIKIDKSAFDGIQDFLEQADIAKTANPGLAFRGCLLTMLMRNNVDKQGRDVLEQRGYPVFQAGIRNAAKVKESTFAKNPLALYAPKCTAAQDYAAFVREYLEGE